MNSKVLYVPLFQSRYGHTEEQGEPVQESVQYSDLVHPAELKRNGELSLGTEATLRRGSWGLLSINEAEQISLLEEARELCSAEPSFLESAHSAANASARASFARHFDPALAVLWVIRTKI